jgi:hypothetical protein
LKNAFQLQNNSKSIWLAGILFSNSIIQALPKIPKLIYLNLYFFLKLSKCLIWNVCLVKQYFSHLSHSIPSSDTGPANQKRSYITFIFKTNLTLG